MSGFASDARRLDSIGGGRDPPSSMDQPRSANRYSTADYPVDREPRRRWPEETTSFDTRDYTDSDSNNSDDRQYTSQNRSQPTRQDYSRGSRRTSTNQPRDERYSGRGDRSLDDEHRANHAPPSRYSSSLPNDTRSSPINIVDPGRRGQDRIRGDQRTGEEAAFSVSPPQDTRYTTSPRSVPRDQLLTQRLPDRTRRASNDDRISTDKSRTSTSLPTSRSPQRYPPSSYSAQRDLSTLNERGILVHISQKNNR
jgi:hypothetical protein